MREDEIDVEWMTYEVHETFCSEGWRKKAAEEMYIQMENWY